MESIEYIEHNKSKLRDLSGRFNFLMATMLVVLAASCYQLFDLYQMNAVITNAEAGDMNASAEFQQLKERDALDYIFGIIGIANIVAVCMFLYMAAKNVYEYFNGATQYTPGWVAGWFFIPVAHIFMPFMAVRELSRGTHTMISEKEAGDIPHQKPHSAMMLWGVIWILQAGMSYLLMLYPLSMMSQLVGMDPDEIEIYVLAKTYYFNIVATVLGLVSGISLLIFCSKLKSEHNNYRVS
jgi:hypothetical protein